MHVDLICANKTTEDVDVCVCVGARAHAERVRVKERWRRKGEVGAGCW